VTKRLKLIGIGVLAFTSAGLVVASASAQGTEATVAPVTTETAPTATTPTTTPPKATASATTQAVTTPPPPPPTTQTTTVAAPEVAPTREVNDIPAFFTSRYTPEKDKASKEAPTSTWRWAGTDYFQQIGVLLPLNTVQTPEALVDTFILLQPRFAFSKNWQLRVRMTASYEFTDNANSTTTRSNELDFGDILPSVAYLGIPSFAGIKTAVSLGLGLPTSPTSQERSMIVSPFVSVGLKRTFEKVLKGDLEVGLIGTFAHPFYQYTTGGLNNDPVYQPACFGASDTGCGLQGTGAANPENTLNLGVTAGGQWGKFGVSLYYLLINQWVYQLGNQPGVMPEPGGAVPFRQLSYFNASLGWDFTSYFTAEVGYQMYRSILTGESQIGNPFFDQYQDWRIYAGWTFHLDKLYDAARGVKEPEKGVVHVHNDRKPITPLAL